MIAYGAVRGRAFGGQGEHALRLLCFQKRGVIVMANNGGKFMIIQPCATQAFVVPRKAHRLNNVQTKTGVGTQADNIAGIRRNFWFE